VGPTVLNPRSLTPLGAKLLVVTGDHGLGARQVRAMLPDLPEATVVVLDDYASLTWADLAADRGERIDAAMRELHRRGPTKLGMIPLSDGAGEVAAIGDGVTRVKVGDRIAGTFHPRWFGGPIRPEYSPTGLAPISTGCWRNTPC
jgi:NADPH:quinone reductase-like Zn-dependent oxidoreductase